MATITKFTLKNFKGIEETEITLLGRVSTPIVTLVGLNESGKTTILEALSHFVSGDPVIAKIFEGTRASTEALSLIPIHKKANFTGSIEISAVVALDEDDIRVFSNIARSKFNLDLDTDRFSNPLTLAKQYIFEDGNLNSESSGNTWSLDLYTKSKRATKFKKYQRPDEGQDLYRLVWRSLLRRLPSISYFPTFLVDLPPRIYLTEHEGETATNRHYRSVFQDVLDSLDEDLDLETHVAQRIVDFRRAEENPNWISVFWGTPGKGQVTSVIQKISNAVSKEIIGSWNKIFHRPTSAKSISLDWNIDTEKNDLPYATIQISDGESQFALHERSLGFRWFFSFLLFTRFKQSTNRETIFLFDEPAANLHARAQSELLQSFDKIIEGGHKVIYSTHSHHMINPLWLSGAYIIENKAIDYDKEDDIAELSNRQTNISANPYRAFVSQFPERVSYYQPVLERLGYINPKIMPVKPVVITEGISDFHAFSAICKSELEDAKFEFVPGLGAGASGPLISFLIASGKPFVVLLDDDRAGRREVENYRNKWCLNEDTVFTVMALDAAFKNTKLETLLSKDTHKIICDFFSKSADTASKKEIGIYFSEKNYTTLEAQDCSAETRKAIRKMVKKLDERF